MSATGSRSLRRILIAIAVGGWPVPDVTSAQETWRLADRPAVSIGSVAGDERYSLDYVRSVVRTAAGHIAIADGDSGVRIYSAAGEYVSRFGEEAGPGEVRDVRTMFAYRGDSIAIAHSRARISVFDANGVFGRSFVNPVAAVPEPDGAGSEDCCYVPGAFPDGSFLVEPPEHLPNQPGRPLQSELTLLRVSPDGSRVDTIGRFPSTRYSSDPDSPDGVRRLHMTSAFDYGIVGERVYGGTGETGKLTVVGPDGTRHPDVLLPLPRLPVTAAVRQAFEDSVRAYFGRFPDVPAAQTATLLAGEFPDTIPAFAMVRTDQSGNLWLAAIPPSTVNEMRVFRVVTPAGRWIATIELPECTSIRWIGHDEITVVQRDERNINRVHVFPLISSPGARSVRPSRGG
jgi:hypothetical protein